VFDSLIVMTKYTLSTTTQITFYKVVFDEDYSSIKISCRNVSFYRYLHFPIFLIIDLHIRLDWSSIHGVHRELATLMQVTWEFVGPLQQL
jgi:hypothetical protein